MSVWIVLPAIAWRIALKAFSISSRNLVRGARLRVMISLTSTPMPEPVNNKPSSLMMRSGAMLLSIRKCVASTALLAITLCRSRR